MRPDPTVLYSFEMYTNNMFHWNMTQPHNVNWGDFCRRDDRIVPHCYQGLLDQPSHVIDAVAKQQNEVRNDFNQALYSKGSATNNTLWIEDEKYYLSVKNGSSSMLQGSQSHTSNVESPVLSDFDKTDTCSTLFSEDVSILDYCNTESDNTDANSGMFYSTTQTSVNESKTLASLGSQQREGENELACSDWPEMDNFDDMLRNWDADNTDELSWLSSNTIYGSEIASKQGFQSSNYGLDTEHAKVEPHYSDANCLLKNMQAVAGNYDEPTHCTYADCLYTDASSIGNSAVIEMSSCIEGNKPVHNSNDRGSNGIGANNVKNENIQSSVDNGTQISTAQMILNSKFPAQEMYFQQNLDQNSQLDFGHHMHKSPLTQITSSADFDEGINQHTSYGNVHCFDNFPEQLFSSQATKSKQSIGAFCQEQNIPHQRKVDDAKMNDAGLETSVRRKRSVATSISSDNSSKINSCFQQLQNVLKQLDAKTKLCIRDSLYRLAKSADQRKDFPTQNCSEAISESEGIQDARTSKRSEELMEAETSTNSIDRVVAYLLLNNSAIPYKSTKPADNARSFNSEFMAVVPEQFDDRALYSGHSDMETDLP